jgi:hypothetical protein
MAAGEDPTNRAQGAASIADAADQELLAIAVELTWFVLGAVGPPHPSA